MTCTTCGLEGQDKSCRRCGEDPGRTHFAVLGIPEGAAMPRVRSAYKKQMLRFHPDMMNGAPDEMREQAAARAVQLNAIKDTLTDPDRRAAYLRRLDETRTRRAANRVAREQAAEKAAAEEQARQERERAAQRQKAAEEEQARIEREQAARAEQERAAERRKAAEERARIQRERAAHEEQERAAGQQRAAEEDRARREREREAREEQQRAAARPRPDREEEARRTRDEAARSELERLVARRLAAAKELASRQCEEDARRAATAAARQQGMLDAIRHASGMTATGLVLASPPPLAVAVCAAGMDAGAVIAITALTWPLMIAIHDPARQLVAKAASTVARFARRISGRKGDRG